MKERKKKVVVIGGGITGMTATYYLQKEMVERNLSLDLTLIEGSHKLGGKIQTVYKDGFIIEKGPDSFLERKQSATELAKDVGLADDLLHNTAGKAYIYVKDQIHPMPKGAVMGIPTELGSFMTTKLFSVQGKLRALYDLILFRSTTREDQSIGDFLRRRLGDEVVENLAEPLLSGIYAADIDQLSLMSTFPQFYEVERKYRSLMLGMKKTSTRTHHNQLTSKNQGVFLTLKNGLQSFVDAIEERLSESSIMKGTVVTSIRKAPKSGYEIELNNEAIIQADSIIVTVPHLDIVNLLPEKEHSDHFKKMRSTTVATIAMAFDEEKVKNALNGTGFVVSRHSDYTITACTWTHKKWPHTTPEGKVLLRCYIGRAGEETVVELSDAEIEEMVLEDLKETMNIQVKPNFTIITRWENAMPQYEVGHKQRIQDVKKKLHKDVPGIYLAGSSYEGLGLPDCIEQGKNTADEVLQYLNENKQE